MAGSVAVVTGSAGLVGAETAGFFARSGMDVVGVDNDARAVFYGSDASTGHVRARLERQFKKHYHHQDIDVRDRDGIDALMRRYAGAVGVVVHAAAQPSHDWSALAPATDFDINAVGTINLLEATRRHASEAVFIFCSTNKVYGDHPNRLPFSEEATRYELSTDHPYRDGIGEDMPVDRCLHSPFGAAKLAGDVMVQEYGRYFGLRTGCFRAGTITGPDHAAAELHGFLAYVMRCALSGRPYTVYGYHGKQVRDVLHATDLVTAFEAFRAAPQIAAVYNIGGGRFSNCSVLEAIALCQQITGRELQWSYEDRHRIGDHIWWISGLSAFTNDYPDWKLTYQPERILREIHDANKTRWTR